MARPITSVTITIETNGAEFTHETNDEMNGVKDDASLTAGIVGVLRKYGDRIHDYGIEHFDYPGCPIISPNGSTVGRIIIEREEDES